MAASITVESTATATVTSGTSIVVDKPTGLVENEALVAVVIASGASVPGINTPAGWEKMQDQPYSDTQDLRIATFNKLATSGDVAASNFTFTTTVSGRIEIVLLRVSSVLVTDLYDAGGSDTGDGTDPTFNISVTASQNKCLYVMGVFGQISTNFADSTVPVINGTNPSWTKYQATHLDVYAASVDTTAAITTADFTFTNSFATTDWVFALSVINGREDTNAVVGFATVGNTGFAPGLRADTNLTIGDFPEFDNSAFNATATGTSPAQWSEPTRTDTTWTNESQ